MIPRSTSTFGVTAGAPALLFLLLASLGGCGGDGPSPESQFENLAFRVHGLNDREVQLDNRRALLDDGVEVLLDDLHLIGRLDGSEGAVYSGILYVAPPQAAARAELVVARVDDRRLTHLASHPLGDGIRAEGIRYHGDEIILHLLTPLPGDAACCPSRPVQRHFRLVDGEIVELPPEPDEAADPAGPPEASS